LDRQQYLLSVCAHADDNQERNRRGFAVEAARTTVPSRISRTIGSSASERAFQDSQSAFTLRQIRLTVSLLTAPPNSALSARRTRRVLVPERYVLAIRASAASVRR